MQTLLIPGKIEINNLIYKDEIFVCLFVCMELIQIYVSEPI
jgi:hypothetical protein